MNAIVTGATKGIGRAIAEKLVREGLNVAICSRHQEDVERTVQELRQVNPQTTILGYRADLSIKAEAISFGKSVLQQFCRIDLLINNAGSFLPGDLCTEPDDTLENMIEVNLYSAYHLTRTIAPSMKKNELLNGSRGHIINMSSIAALKAYKNGGSYSISKYALEGFSKNLREELKPDLIKVSTLNPGATMSDSWSGSGVDPDRILRAEDIADIVWAIVQLSPQAVVEEIVMRPQLGDL